MPKKLNDIFNITTPDVTMYALAVEITDTKDGPVSRVIGADEFEIFQPLCRYVDLRRHRLQAFTKKNRRRGMRPAELHELWQRACREVK